MSESPTRFQEAYGWALPPDDRHFAANLACAPEVLGRRVYQAAQFGAVLDTVISRRVAIDIGAHVGFWSYYLAKYFAYVHAFEPVAGHVECFRRNVTDGNVVLHEIALGSRRDRVQIESAPENSGAAHVARATEGAVPLDTLDSFGLQDVDLVKIDVEGYESFVVQGARRTLIRSRPIVIVEQKRGGERYGVPPLKAVHQIERLGARVLRRVYDDYILGWPPAGGRGAGR
ncbi:MAG: hypothetical protein A3I02_13225 [Betaproteobacteria bacterium RIFCSPLOWO2_02_FULL_67_26]|nr:MAG: hypothetical protein A3I02_13225 [Betaproteobacteria bacterium RIFCSPLOWO2_02_FULL_67_26]